MAHPQTDRYFVPAQSKAPIFASISLFTLMLDPGRGPIARHLLDKHYLRKHGRDAYYGQTGER